MSIHHELQQMSASSNARIRLALRVLACYDFGEKKVPTADDLDSLRVCLGHEAGCMSFGQIACAVIEQELDELKRSHAESNGRHQDPCSRVLEHLSV